MGKKVHFNVAKTVPDTAAAIAVAIKETAIPENTLEIVDRSSSIEENITTKFEWKRYVQQGASPYYYDTWSDDETGQSGILPVTASGGADQLIVTNISAFPDASGKLPIPLPYYYDLKFDHWSGTDNPEAYLDIVNESGDKIEYVYFKTRKSAQTYYSGFGGSFVDVGSFILGTSRLDSQAARTALGENKWQEQWGTSVIDSHRAWELANPKFQYPPWQEVSTKDHSQGQDTMLEGDVAHAAIDRETAITGEYYVTASGFWAAGDDSIGEYTAGTSIEHPDGTDWGEPLTPGDGTVASDLTIAGADATIGELLQADTLGGVSFVPDASGADQGAWRFRLYIPEDIVNRPEQTFWIRYNKFNHPKDVEFGYKEVINPIQLNKEGRDYTIDFTNPAQPALNAAANGGLNTGEDVQDNYAYIKRRDEERIFIESPTGTERQHWYLRIHNGRFSVGSKTVDVNNVATGDSSGEETHNVFYNIPELNTQNYYAINWADPDGGLAGHGTHTMFEGLSANETPRLGKAVKERVDIIDEFTIRVKNRPLYFWDGDYGKDEDTGNQIGGGQFNYYTNGYPLYTPPHIVDHDLSEVGYLPDESEVSTHPKYSHGINIYINDTLLDNTHIQQWDFFNGIIKLSTRILPDDNVRATYLYRQNFAIGNYLDLNPTFNHFGGDIVGEVIRVVIKPNWDEEIEGTRHYYGLDTLDASDHKLAWHLLRENRTGSYSYDFINASGTVGFNLVHDPANPSGAVALPQQTLVLGDIVIKEHNIDDTEYLDARVRGGGIKSDVWFDERIHAARPDTDPGYNARKSINKESEFYWDIGYWDGLPYQAEGILVIKIPLSKRIDLKNEIVQARYPITNIHPDYKDAVDEYFITHGQSTGQFNYVDYAEGTYEGAYASVTAGLDYTNPNHRIIMDGVRDYIDLQTKAYEEADRRIMSIIDKHVALGTFYVIIDEDNNLWPIRYRRN